MTKIGKNGDEALVRRYFVEEKIVALPLSIAFLAAISASGLGGQAGDALVGVGEVGFEVALHIG